MKQGLIQQQTLQRKMNQSLIQSIQMLQFTSMELYDFMKEIALENPLIEEVIYDSTIEQYKYRSSDAASFVDINPAEKNLYERLKDQLYTLNLSEELRPVIEYGIDSLDNTGYLDISLEEWALNCQTTVPITEQALMKIQQLEPYGIGARSLGECILLQLRHMEGYNAYMASLLLEHLEWIADNNYEAIMETYDTNEDEITELIKMIQSCDPKPGQLLETKAFEYIVPEATIYQENNSWKISYHNWTTPKIILNPSYKQLEDKEAKKFLKEKRQQLDWLQQAVQYRTSTIEAVIRKIFEKQQAFFEKDLLHLRSLTLSEIAGELDLHVSTISRAISNKYIQTPHGLFAIKFFFQPGVKQKNGETVTIVIKKWIRDLIESEDKQKPLSDEKIRGRLQVDYSLDIARRTVMKYRQQLKIPSSIKRKKER